MLEYTTIISSVIGGALALTGGYISVRLSDKYRKNEWERTEKYKVYIQTINVLKELHIPCLVTEKAFSAQLIELDTDELRSWLEHLSEFLKDNNAQLFLFLPKGLYRKILELRSLVFYITEDKNVQELHFEDLRESPIIDAIMLSNNIAHELKSDLQL